MDSAGRSETTSSGSSGEALDVASGFTFAGQLSRRAVLRVAAITGAGVPLVAACGSSSPPKADAATSASRSTTSSSAGQGSASAGAPGAAVAATSDVPKGGGLVLNAAGVVITQPNAGTFKGFSSTCTHAGCPLDNVSNGTINCICHGSQFSIEDGSVVNGPATVPLPKKPLSVRGEDISLK